MLQFSATARATVVSTLAVIAREIVFERVDRGDGQIGVCIQIVDCMEPLVRIAALWSSGTKVVRKRVQPPLLHIRILDQIKGTVKIRVWIPPFICAPPQIMRQRIELRRRDIAVFRQVITAVEKEVWEPCFGSAKKKIVEQRPDLCASD